MKPVLMELVQHWQIMMFPEYVRANEKLHYNILPQAHREKWTKRFSDKVFHDLGTPSYIDARSKEKHDLNEAVDNIMKIKDPMHELLEKMIEK